MLIHFTWLCSSLPEHYCIFWSFLAAPLAQRPKQPPSSPFGSADTVQRCCRWNRVVSAQQAQVNVSIFAGAAFLHQADWCVRTAAGSRLQSVACLRHCGLFCGEVCKANASTDSANLLGRHRHIFRNAREVEIWAGLEVAKLLQSKDVGQKCQTIVMYLIVRNSVLKASRCQPFESFYNIYNCLPQLTLNVI